MDSINKMMEQSDIGCAKHQMIYDDAGKPVDYLFFAVNPAFERLTGLKREELLNKRVSEVMPTITDDTFDWIGYYGKVVTEGQKRVFEQYFSSLDKWYRVEAFSCYKDCFITLFTDITHERELVEASKAFLNDGKESNTYEQITQRMKRITGADYVALNIFMEDGKHFQTAAIAGFPDSLQKAIHLLGFNPEKKEWSPDYNRFELIKDMRVTTFDHLHELTGNVLSKTAIQLVEKTFNLGQTAIIKSTQGDRIIGDFTLMFTKGKELQNENEAIIYADMVAMLIENRRGLQRLAEKEKQLRENQIRLELAMDSSEHGFWDKNLDTGEIYCSPQFYTMLGYEPGEFEMTSDVWRTLIHPEDRSFVPELPSYLEKSEQSEDHFRLKCKDGGFKWIASRAKGHERDSQGIPHRAVGVHVDIDELKQKTEALKESHLMAKMGRWDYYHKQNNLQWSEEIFDIFKVDSEQFDATYRAFIERVHPDDREHVAEAFENSVADHQTCEIEHKLLLDDGRIKWVKERWYTEHDENGQPRHSIGIVQDITERKQAEEQLRESEGKLSALFASMTEMIVLHEMVFDDADKPVNYRITDCNTAFTNITGIHREDAVGKLATELYRTSQPPYLDELTRVAITGKPYHYKTYFEPMNKHFDISVISHGKNHFATITTDITEQKEFERKLQIAKEQAESANQAKSEFLANMNHELRTPLNGIIGFTDILRNTPLNKEQHEYADIVYTSGKHLADIISDILDLARIEAGKFELNEEKTNLKDLVEKTLFIVRPKAKSKGLSLGASIENDVPETVEVDGSRLRQVLINLVANAIKFTDEGSITVSVSLQERQSNNARLLFKVTDTGMGIKEEEKAKIFEAFRQADMATEKKAQGTGLGLAISKKLLEMMQSSLELNSVYGEGSTFYFELLLTCEQERTVETEEADLESMDEQGVFTNKKILIAEDNAINMRYMQAAIAMFSKDTRIIKAKDGKEAYHLYREHQPDLILMDIRMPHVDGYHATAMIRQHDRQIPIIAMTAKALEEDKEKCLAAGMNEYITKPVSLEQLKEALIKHL